MTTEFKINLLIAEVILILCFAIPMWKEKRKQKKDNEGINKMFDND